VYNIFKLYSIANITHDITNGTGTLTLAKSYAPYGDVTYSAGSGASPFAFTGEQMDASGLTYLRARYYASGTGRFLTRDTWMGDYNRPLSLNRWLYVEGNPINRTDPTGKSFGDPISPMALLINRSKNPENFNPNDSPPLLSWNPSVGVSLTTDIEQNVKEAQYTVKGFERGELGFSLCGIVALAMILETATGIPDQLYYIWDKGLSQTTNTIGIPSLIEAATRTFPKSQEWQGRAYIYNQILFYDGATGKSHYEQYGGPNWYGNWQALGIYPKLKTMLQAGHYVIAGVTIVGSGWGQVVTTNGVGHWVVITGLSGEWNSMSEDSEWNWVRINNTFANRVEYYPWHYFKDSMKNQGYTIGELWHNK